MPEVNPKSQLGATTYLRIFVQAAKAETIRAVLYGVTYNFMQHFPGMNCTLDWRLMSDPLPFLGYFPALVSQKEIKETVNIIGDKHSTSVKSYAVGPPRVTEALRPRDNYDTTSPRRLMDFGRTKPVALGDLLLARSGDKGANVNVGFTPRAYANNEETWDWMRSFLTRARIRQMMGDDWRDWYHIERVEFPGIRAVHFVVYGALGRGVSSSARLDSLGKGFAEFLRAVHVPVPVKFLNPEISSRL